jgi:molecular chaperone GrpE
MIDTQQGNNDGVEEVKADLGAGVEVLETSAPDLDDVEFETFNEDAVVGSGSMSPADKIAKLKDELKEARAEAQKNLDGWQRERADFANLKKRTEEEKSQIMNLARESVADEFIPVIESFDMAFANKEAWEKVDPNWRMGVEYIHKQFVGAFANIGVREVAPNVGDAFDAGKHAAIGNEPTSDASLDNKIAALVQKGYSVGERVIRVPKVKVYAYTAA